MNKTKLKEINSVGIRTKKINSAEGQDNSMSLFIINLCANAQAAY